MNFRELFFEGKKRLEEADCPEPMADARALLFHEFHFSLADYAGKSADEAPEEGVRRYLALIEERMTRRPLAYITGEAPFYGRDFYVNENVLIPRFDTEILVEETLAVLKEGDSVLDLCTGSGCIPVTLALEGPEGCSVTGSDISEAALAVARRNSERHKAGVNYILSDLFENIPGRYAIITANPPYICSAVIETLMPEVRGYEPRLALDGAEDGLHFYRRIAAEAREHLIPGGRLLMEIGYDQAEAVLQILKDAGYTGGRIVQDLVGLDRVAAAVYGADDDR